SIQLRPPLVVRQSTGAALPGPTAGHQPSAASRKKGPPATPARDGPASDPSVTGWAAPLHVRPASSLISSRPREPRSTVTAWARPTNEMPDGSPKAGRQVRPPSAVRKVVVAVPRAMVTEPCPASPNETWRTLQGWTAGGRGVRAATSEARTGRRYTP